MDMDTDTVPYFQNCLKNYCFKKTLLSKELATLVFEHAQHSFVMMQHSFVMMQKCKSGGNMPRRSTPLLECIR